MDEYIEKDVVLELIDEHGWLSHKCTNCGYTKRTDVHVSLDWKYCPMCGAKMDG